MIYFFHHYELPNFLSDGQLSEMLVRIAPPPQLIESFQIEVVSAWSPSSQPGSSSSTEASSRTQFGTDIPQSDVDIQLSFRDPDSPVVRNRVVESSSVDRSALQPRVSTSGDNPLSNGDCTEEQRFPVNPSSNTLVTEDCLGTTVSGWNPHIPLFNTKISDDYSNCRLPTIKTTTLDPEINPSENYPFISMLSSLDQIVLTCFLRLNLFSQ